MAKQSILGYPDDMKRWIFSLLLVLFTINVGFAAHGSMGTIADHQQTAAHAAMASNDVSEAVSRCCMEMQEKGQGTPCMADGTFVSMLLGITFPPRQQDHDGGIEHAFLSRGVGAVFRPPIT